MTAWILFALAGLTLALALHPLTTYPLSLALLRRIRGVTDDPGPAESGKLLPPSFSLLVCAHNEQAVIADKLDNLVQLLDAAPGAAEALIYVDGSTDRTEAIIRDHPDPRIRAVVSAERTGKTVGLNRLAAEARGDILLLGDANVTVDPEAPRLLAECFRNLEVGLVCGHLCYVNGTVNTTARNGAAYWRLQETIRQLESDTGSAIGADGSLYAVRRGLWPDVPGDLIDDFYVPMKVRFDGRRVIRAGNVRAYELTSESGKDEFWRKVRIACQSFNVHRRLWPAIRHLPGLDRYKYVSSKLLKWLIGFNLGAALLLATAGLALLVDPVVLVGWLATGGLAIAALTFLGAGPVAALGNASLMFAAVSWGVVRSLQGERFVTWQPVGSVRTGRVAVVPPPGRSS
jgi:cellulose synthase/poly-beta-1,6-N-acetylglucosamine synthase-like glycosyltransferase